MDYKANTPEGTRDCLFGECGKRRAVQESLTGLFRARGFAEAITPAVEFYDTFQRSGSRIPQESMLKIIDRSGKICVLRPDCTMQIARVAATKLRTLPLPQRLYYSEDVYRSKAANAGVNTEVPQCGVELIGAEGKKADLEIIATAVDALRRSGAEQFHIELGHVGFFRGLAARMDMDADTVEEMRLLIEGKKFAALNDLLSGYRDQPGYPALARLSRLFGGPEVLEEAEQLSGGNEALTYLRELYGDLCQAGYGEAIKFDLGIVNQINYYTGVVFRGYAEGAGDAVLSGGRYDSLVEAYGRKAAATGFAVDVDALAGCLPTPEFPKIETVIHYDSACLSRAIARMDSLPPLRCELSPFETTRETLEMAREKGARTVLVIDGDGERSLTV